MKRAYFGIALLPLAAFGLAACPSFGVDFCEGAACGDVSDGSTQDGPIVPTGCDLTKDPKDSAACVDDTIGIFVSASGADSNSGTKSSPMKTIGAALGKTDSQHVRVYVCEGAYPETVKVTKAVGIFGGFACADWSYSGKLPKVGPTTPGYALDVESVTGAVTAEDLELDAPNATEPGGSSIAVFVTQSTNVMLKRVTANAGNGADGAEAVATSNWETDTDGGVLHGNPGAADTGGAAKDCSASCANGVGSVGGKGGNGDVAPPAINGGDGGPALPPFPDSAHDGRGGSGGASCTNGDLGADAPNADAGTLGAQKAGLLSGRWTSTSGATGDPGSPGQGGGGGGGFLTGGSSNGGGGGGGCGGCGGAGGIGGGSGGSSFAVLVFQSAITFDTSAAKAASAGNGKQGGAGQLGQPGGLYGDQTSGGSACRGGAGGRGGAGAGGGGGAGGNSIAIGYVGTKPNGDGRHDERRQRGRTWRGW